MQSKKKDSEKTEKFSKIDFLAIFVLIIFIIDLHSFGFFGRTTFPQDPAIIFEGSYRISEGQIPYKDFTIVMGPVIFLMQAFFNLFFGKTFFSMFMHSLFLSLIISLIFYYFVRREFNIIISFIFSITFYISFQGLAFHPFYNHSTYFFLFLNIFLLLYYIDKFLPNHIFLLSSLLAFLDFYTKQDIGSLHIILVFFYFIFNYKKQWKSILLFYIIPVFLLVVGTYLAFSAFTDFAYWFNLGQYPHNSRLSNLRDPMKILEIFNSWEFYISLLFIFLVLFIVKDGNFSSQTSTFSNKSMTKRENINVIYYSKNNKNKSIMSLFLVIAISSLINRLLTGVTRQVSVISTILLVFLLSIIIKVEIKEFYKKNKPIFIIIFSLILIISVNPFPTYGLIAYNYFSNSISHIDVGCYKGSPILKEDLESLNHIRKIIEDNNKSFVSITHYSFLYCDYQIEPPKGLPAWFDEGNSFYKINLDSIIKVIINYNPKVILVQEAHNNEDPNFNDELIKKFLSKGYKLEEIINQKSTQKPISVLLKY